MYKYFFIFNLNKYYRVLLPRAPLVCIETAHSPGYAIDFLRPKAPIVVSKSLLDDRKHS